MTIQEAAQLVIQTTTLAKGGEVFLLDMGEPVKINNLAKQMIRLSGLSIKDKTNPEGDIEIIYTGIRPGEKLYEELLIDAKTQKTDHPLIFRANEKFIPIAELFPKLDSLKKMLLKRDKKRSLKILNELVVEWEKST